MADLATLTVTLTGAVSPLQAALAQAERSTSRTLTAMQASASGAAATMTRALSSSASSVQIALTGVGAGAQRAGSALSGALSSGAHVAQSALRAAVNAAQSVTGALSNIAHVALSVTGSALRSLGRIAEYAAGQLLAMGAARAAGSVRQALSEYADYERLGMSLQALVAREVMATGQAQDMARAMQMATGRAEELRAWIEQLAIRSPFDQQGVAVAFRTALAYGFTTQEAQRLTRVMIDFASATGQGTDVMNSIALALGQVRARGKLAGQEILQLTNAGLDVRDALSRALNKPRQEIEALIEAGIDADTAISAIVQTLERDFGGAATAQAGTFSGLLSSLSDIRRVLTREFFAPAFRAVQPYLERYIEMLQSPENIERTRRLGEAVGTMVGRLLSGLERALPMLREFGIQLGGSFDFGFRFAGVFERVGEAVPRIFQRLAFAVAAVGRIVRAYLGYGLSAAINELARVIAERLHVATSAVEMLLVTRIGRGALTAADAVARMARAVVENAPRVTAKAVETGRAVWTAGVTAFGWLRDHWRQLPAIAWQTAQDIGARALAWLSTVPGLLAQKWPALKVAATGWLAAVWQEAEPAVQRALNGLWASVSGWAAAGIETVQARVRAKIDELTQDGPLGLLRRLLLGDDASADPDALFGQIAGKALGPLMGLLGGAVAGPLGAAAGGIAGMILGDMPGVQEALANVPKWIREHLPEAGKALGELRATVEGALAGAKAWIEENWPKVSATISGAVSGALADIRRQMDDPASGLGHLVSAFRKARAWVEEHWPSVRTTVESVLVNLGARLGPILTPIREGIEGAFGKVTRWIDENMPLILDTVQAVLRGVDTFLQSPLAQGIASVLGGIFQTAARLVGAALDIILGIVKLAMQLITGDTQGAGETFKQVIQNIFWGALDVVAGAFNAMADLAKLAMGAIIDGVTAQMQWLMDALAANPVVKLGLDALGIDLNGAKSEIERLAGQMRGALGIGQRTDLLALLGVTRADTSHLGSAPAAPSSASGAASPSGSVYNVYIQTQDDPQRIADAVTQRMRLIQMLGRAT